MACKIRIKVKKKKYIRGDNTTMKYTSIIIPFVGGLGMFIYGMQIMAQGLENAAGNRMKSLLEAQRISSSAYCLERSLPQ